MFKNEFKIEILPKFTFNITLSFQLYLVSKNIY